MVSKGKKRRIRQIRGISDPKKGASSFILLLILGIVISTGIGGYISRDGAVPGYFTVVRRASLDYVAILPESIGDNAMHIASEPGGTDSGDIPPIICLIGDYGQSINTYLKWGYSLVNGSNIVLLLNYMEDPARYTGDLDIIGYINRVERDLSEIAGVNISIIGYRTSFIGYGLGANLALYMSITGMFDKIVAIDPIWSPTTRLSATSGGSFAVYGNSTDKTIYLLRSGLLAGVNTSDPAVVSRIEPGDLLDRRYFRRILLIGTRNHPLSGPGDIEDYRERLHCASAEFDGFSPQSAADSPLFLGVAYFILSGTLIFDSLAAFDDGNSADAGFDALRSDLPSHPIIERIEKVSLIASFLYYFAILQAAVLIISLYTLQRPNTRHNSGSIFTHGPGFISRYALFIRYYAARLRKLAFPSITPGKGSKDGAYYDAEYDLGDIGNNGAGMNAKNKAAGDLAKSDLTAFVSSVSIFVCISLIFAIATGLSANLTPLGHILSNISLILVFGVFYLLAYRLKGGSTRMRFRKKAISDKKRLLSPIKRIGLKLKLEFDADSLREGLVFYIGAPLYTGIYILVNIVFMKGHAFGVGLPALLDVIYVISAASLLYTIFLQIKRTIHSEEAVEISSDGGGSSRSASAKGLSGASGASGPSGPSGPSGHSAPSRGIKSGLRGLGIYAVITPLILFPIISILFIAVQSALFIQSSRLYPHSAFSAGMLIYWGLIIALEYVLFSEGDRVGFMPFAFGIVLLILGYCSI